MFYWTIQNKSVVDIIHEKKEYLPDFAKSNAKFPNGYNFLLNAFNLFNENLGIQKGLIFTFDRSLNAPIETLDDIRELFANPTMRDFVQKGGITDDLFKNPDSYLLQLGNYDRSIFDLPIDISRFTYIEDFFDEHGKMRLERYNDLNCRNQINDIMTCWNRDNGFKGWLFPHAPSNILQKHLPYIKTENLMAEYRLIDIIE